MSEEIGNKRCENEECECEIGMDYEEDELQILVICPFQETEVLLCPQCYDEKSVPEEGIIFNDNHENVDVQDFIHPY